uniref:G-protein coupled receptors family 1 profile domain-containing protein n=1 Tax=Denticeps clupeoides TaxID=299321 RepID=A0AAY4AN99_9TELE
MVFAVLFGTWYNGSGFAEEHSVMLMNPNASQSKMELFTHEWLVFLFLRDTWGHCRFALLQLRQQTRYLLLANALLSDLLFVSLYFLSTCLNAAGVLMSDWTCAFLLFLLGVLHIVDILSAKAMVLDTSLAVLAPLRYLTLWPVSRTWYAIAAIWGMSVGFPLACVGVFIWQHSVGPCSLHICSLPLFLVLTVSHSLPLQVSMLLAVAGILVILVLVFLGYFALYMLTLQSGVWRGQRSTRARGTLLIHYLSPLFSRFCPMLVLIIELLLYCRSRVLNLRANLWVSLVVCNVLLVLAQGLGPLLVWLRYRDLQNMGLIRF